MEYDDMLKASREAYKAVLKELDLRLIEINELRQEINSLKQKIDQLSPGKPDAIHLPLPTHFVFNGVRWGVQYKQVGKYRYIYLFKRLNKKLHQLNIGKSWDEDKARMKLVRYLTEKKLIFNR